MEPLLPSLLVAQGVLGGVDTLLNHELVARLPYRVEARREIALHSVREATYATLFIGLGWFEWHGAFALAIAALVVLEILVTASDEWLENRTRLLPQNERVLHVLLTLNLGLIIAVLAPQLLQWGSMPTALRRVDHGWTSWALAALGAVAAFWCLRDAAAWRRLRRVA